MSLWEGSLRITLYFQVNNEPDACAVTGAEGDVTDLILPNVGDVVSHRDVTGKPCLGRVTSRLFTYDLPDGDQVDGAVTVMLSLDRLPLH